ncbi:hypothetical protein [Massilia consociata]|uniref:Uncharacterized protein n=1 Tax=Massilia consociata TaxID=760117 RepID=A0ABV6FAB5_9BURK
MRHFLRGMKGEDCVRHEQGRLEQIALAVRRQTGFTFETAVRSSFLDGHTDIRAGGGQASLAVVGACDARGMRRLARRPGQGAHNRS